MIQEDKILLLKDLCSRLPYYPKCEMIDELRVVNNEKDSSYISTLFPKHIELFSYHNNFTIKPYLRSMSNMNEEEKEEYRNIDNRSYSCPIDYAHIPASDRIDWLNAHHFDFRNLIGRGLALEAPEGMYN